MRKTLKTVVPITSKNPASVFVQSFLAQEQVEYQFVPIFCTVIIRQP